MKIFRAQKDRRKRKSMIQTVNLVLIGLIVNRTGELVLMIFKGQEPEALSKHLIHNQLKVNTDTHTE